MQKDLLHYHPLSCPLAAHQQVLSCTWLASTGDQRGLSPLTLSHCVPKPPGGVASQGHPARSSTTDLLKGLLMITVSLCICRTQTLSLISAVTSNSCRAQGKNATIREQFLPVEKLFSLSALVISLVGRQCTSLLVPALPAHTVVCWDPDVLCDKRSKLKPAQNSI